jgi:hypothetical protein
MAAHGQYAGPAVLARGEAPAAVVAPQIRFRPVADISATYNTGLAGVLLQPGTNQLASASSMGVRVGFGIGGAHSWRHSRLGLDYRGSISHYNSRAYYDGLNQSLQLSFNHAFTKHATFNLRQTAGIFTRDFGLLSLQQTIAFDPAASQVPRTDFFDNRTLYSNSQADFVLRKSARLTFALGGDTAFVYRRSDALNSSKVFSARGDTQYRLTRRTTIGAMYQFSHLGYSRSLGNTIVHGFAGTYSIALSRSVEFSAYGGFYRLESKFIQTTAIDPLIAALLGITQSTQIVHSINYAPNISARISKTVHNGVIFAGGGNSVTPGNGLFGTSVVANVFGGYMYTGLRRWSFGVQSDYSRGEALGGFVSGTYGSTTAGLSMSRSLGRRAHFVASYRARQYNSPNYDRYNRFINEAQVGVAFAPGDVALRFW